MTSKLFVDNDNDIVESQFRFSRTQALQIDVEMYFSLAYRSSGGPVEDASNATPIVITATGHGLSTGDLAVVFAAGGNTAARGTWPVTVLDADTFALDDSAGNGDFVPGGFWRQAVPGAAAIPMAYDATRLEYCGILLGAIPLDITPQTYVLVRYAMDEYFTRWFKIDEQVSVVRRK